MEHKKFRNLDMSSLFLIKYSEVKAILNTIPLKGMFTYNVKQMILKANSDIQVSCTIIFVLSHSPQRFFSQTETGFSERTIYSPSSFFVSQ